MYLTAEPLHPSLGEGLLLEASALDEVLREKHGSLPGARIEAHFFSAGEVRDVIIDVFLVAQESDFLTVAVLDRFIEARDVEDGEREFVLGLEMRVQPRDDVVSTFEPLSPRLLNELQYTILGDAFLRSDRFFIDASIDGHVPDRTHDCAIAAQVDDHLRGSPPDGAEPCLEEPEVFLVMRELRGSGNGRSIRFLEEVSFLPVEDLD